MSEAFTAWIDAAPDAQVAEFRQAVHVIVTAFGSSPNLHEASFMKGGILMAIQYGSPRFTSDIDFSTPQEFKKATASVLLEQLSVALIAASEALPYGIACRLQSSTAKPPPSPTHTWVNLQMKIGYVQKGTIEHTRKPQGPWSKAIQIDYSFLESVPKAEVLEIGEDRTVCVYALTTLIAEKFRALLQQESRGRVRRQDIFDIHFLLTSRENVSDSDRKEILQVLLQKAAERNIEVTAGSFATPALYERAIREYPTLQDELQGPLPDFDMIFGVVRKFYEALPWGS